MRMEKEVVKELMHEYMEMSIDFYEIYNIIFVIVVISFLFIYHR